MDKKSNRPVSLDLFPLYCRTAKIQHPYKEQLNKSNPYTGELIVDPASYERYIREHAYYDLCDRQIEINNKKIQQELDYLHANLATAQKGASTSDRYRRNSKRLLWFFLASILSIVIIIVVANRKIDNAFSEGHSAGYSKGQEAGYQDGYDVGYSDGKNNGYDEGYSKGEDAGYKEGYQKGSSVSRSSSNFSDGPRAAPIADSYIGNRKTKKFHLSSCSYLPDENHQIVFDSRDEAISNGYDPCGHCNP